MLYQNKYRIESARCPGWNYRACGWYFVTICSHLNAHSFGEVICDQMRFSRIGAIADAELHTLASHYKNVQVNTHVVMPNHIHAIIMIEGDHSLSPNPRPMPRPHESRRLPVRWPAIIRSYKAGVSWRCRGLLLTEPIWQPRFYDTILRSDAIISAVREYIRNNPANWCEDCGEQNSNIEM